MEASKNRCTGFCGAMGGYLIVVPVWGDHYSLFRDYGVRSLRAALGDREAKFLIRTDNPAGIKRCLYGYEVDARTVEGPSYDTFCQGHREGVDEAPEGTRVVLLCADHVVSGNFFDGLDWHFAFGAEAVVMSGFRTRLEDVEGIPIGAKPRDLLKWGLEHPHKITQELFWGAGGATTPSTLFFERGDTVIHRGFHLHPVAIEKKRVITGGGHNRTIDDYLLENFAKEDIRVITDADDIALLEVSPHWRNFRGPPVEMDNVVQWAKTQTTPMHRWLFTHRMVMRGGNEDPGDREVCDRILEALGGQENA